MTVLRTLSGVALTLVVAVLSIPNATAQDFMEHSRQMGPAPEEKHPTVSDKDYKAALQKIPTPTEKYDPWGGTRPADQTKTANKSAKKTN